MKNFNAIWRAAICAALFFLALPSAARAAVPVPLTDEEMTRAAALIVVVEVTAVERADAPHPQFGSAAQPAIAAAQVEETLKGYASGTVFIQFAAMRSGRRIRPEPPELEEGERALLFLRYDRATGKHAFVTDYQGKERPDEARIEALRGEAEEGGFVAGLEASVELDSSFTSDGNLKVEFKLKNAGSTPILLNAALKPAAILTLSQKDAGNVAPIWKEEESGGPNGQSEPFTLAPGQFMGFTANLADIFSLPQSGAYRLGAVYESSRLADADSRIWTGSVSAPAVDFVYRTQEEINEKIGN